MDCEEESEKAAKEGHTPALKKLHLRGNTGAEAEEEKLIRAMDGGLGSSLQASAGSPHDARGKAHLSSKHAPPRLRQRREAQSLLGLTSKSLF